MLILVEKKHLIFSVSFFMMSIGDILSLNFLSNSNLTILNPLNSSKMQDESSLITFFPSACCSIKQQNFSFNSNTLKKTLFFKIQNVQIKSHVFFKRINLSNISAVTSSLSSSLFICIRLDFLR